MSLQNLGVGAEGLMAGAAALSADSDQFGNDGRVEEMWAMKAAEHAEVYFNLLCSVEPSRLKLTVSQELDDRIYSEFKQSFPDLNVAKFVEDDIKNEKAKAEWRKFSEGFKDVEDYSLGCLLRLDSGKDYTEENTVIAIKIQFLAIEIVRNRDGCNDSLRTNFKPSKSSDRGQVPDGLPHSHDPGPQSSSPVTIPIQSSPMNKCHVCDFQHEKFSKVRGHLRNHLVSFCHNCRCFVNHHGMDSSEAFSLSFCRN